MTSVHDLLTALAISLAIQAAFFAIAASLRTDKVTDLSYGLTFIVLALWLLARTPEPPGAALVLAGMVVAWGVRLAGYLFYRILHMGRDRRFDGIREHFWKFLQFWVFQGVVVWIVLLPVLLWFGAPGAWHAGMAAGLTVWAVGLVLETVADLQKFRAKSRPGGTDRWVDSGLWRYSRHPNYFGELLCWWGVWLFTAWDLGPLLAAVAATGPAVLTYVLLRVSGVPTLEASARRKWAGDPDYEAYRARTRLLVPWPRRSARTHSTAAP